MATGVWLSLKMYTKLLQSVTTFRVEISFFSANCLHMCATSTSIRLVIECNVREPFLMPILMEECWMTISLPLRWIGVGVVDVVRIWSLALWWIITWCDVLAENKNGHSKIRDTLHCHWFSDIVASPHFTSCTCLDNPTSPLFPSPSPRRRCFQAGILNPSSKFRTQVLSFPPKHKFESMSVCRPSCWGFWSNPSSGLDANFWPQVSNWLDSFRSPPNHRPWRPTATPAVDWFRGNSIMPHGIHDRGLLSLLKSAGWLRRKEGFQMRRRHCCCRQNSHCCRDWSGWLRRHPPKREREINMRLK